MCVEEGDFLYGRIITPCEIGTQDKVTNKTEGGSFTLKKNYIHLPCFIQESLRQKKMVEIEEDEMTRSILSGTHTKEQSI